MALYFNKNSDKFIECRNSEIYVDKSELIKKCNQRIKTLDKFMAVTRPRRFGKTMALSMLNAYYSKGCDSRELFSDLAISKDQSFEKHLNKHNVIWVDMADLYTGLTNKEIFINKLKELIYNDLKEAFPMLELSYDIADGTFLSRAIVEINSKLDERFIFLIDEWDVIYREQEKNKRLCDEYTEFLRNMFKSTSVSSCIDLVYMTGILPIRRYSTQSTLNMFTEYNMVSPKGLESYIGFTENEVKALCEKYNKNFSEMKAWYDGYKLKGTELYNPKSVVESILYDEYGDYWVQTSSIEAVTDYMNYDHGQLKGAIARMLSGGKEKVDPQRFDNDLTNIDSKDAALTVLIHLGYLAYDEETCSCYIPNHEIKTEFERALKKLDWSEIYDPISNSEKLYEETMKGNVAFIDETLDRNHREMASVFNKNKEDVLGIIVLMSYYRAKKFYLIKKEDNSALGRADLTFIPRDGQHMPLIIELKADSSPEEAISQIKEKEYSSSFGDYKGKIMLLGISYDSKTLKHHSKIEIIER